MPSTPPFGGRNFGKIKAEQLHHEVAHLLYITTWQMFG